MRNSLLSKLGLAAILILAVGQVPNFLTGAVAPASATETAWGEPTIGQVSLFAGNFAPRGWAKCEGQLLAINENQALFSIIGTTYGGDGRTTFALPDLRGRSVVGVGQGPGLTNRPLGGKFGAEQFTLPTTTIAIGPGAGGAGRARVATSTRPGSTQNGSTAAGRPVRADAGQATTSTAQPVTVVTADWPVETTSPGLAMTYIIALQGTYPPRN